MLGESVAHVILVDDEPMVLASLSSLITLETNHAPVTFERARDALTYLEGGEPAHVIISDILMPQMNGLEFLTSARDLRPEVPRMILSGYAELRAPGTDFTRAGALVHMEKPWDNEVLLDNIRQAITYGGETAA